MIRRFAVPQLVNTKLAAKFCSKLFKRSSLEDELEAKASAKRSLETTGLTKSFIQTCARARADILTEVNRRAGLIHGEQFVVRNRETVTVIEAVTRELTILV